VFELGIPIGPEELLEYIDKSLRKNLLRFSRFNSERIETEWIRFVCWIEYYHITIAALRNMHHHLIDEITVRIDDSESLAIIDIIDHLTDEELTLSDSGLTDDIHMPESILIIYSDWYSDTTII
jgi:hypothetical protein